MKIKIIISNLKNLFQTESNDYFLAIKKLNDMNKYFENDNCNINEIKITKKCCYKNACNSLIKVKNKLNYEIK